MDCTNGNELFQWQNGDSFLQNNSPLDISDLTWEGDTQDEDFSYILEETTPVKACGGSPHNFGYCGKRRKELDDECQVTSSRVKRRRTLQFKDEDFDLTSLIDDHAFLKSKENIDGIDEVFSETSQQGLGSQEASSFPGLACLDQVEDWLGDCFNDSEMHNPSTDMNSCGTNDLLLDIEEFIIPPTSVAPSTAPKQPIRSSRNVAFKGTQSYIQTQTKMAAAFKVHPFSFIKPSELNGDMTLKAINQRIQIPPKPKANDPTIYGMSAFSGKPVVNKTRIRTEGGKGSITIMRTKG